MFPKQLKSLIIATYVLFACQALAEAPFKFDVAGFAGNNRNFFQVGAFLPIMQNEDGLLFSDIRGMKHLLHFKKKNKTIYSEDVYEFNFGLGYRRIIDQDLVFGGVAYYDIRKAQLKDTNFSQATLNFHILSQTWQSNLNLYAPIGKNKITKSSHVFTNKAKIVNNDVFFKYQDQNITEKAMKGLDFRVSTIIPNINSLRVGAVVYYFQGDKSFIGGGPEINFAYNDSINIESSITYDKLRKANFITGIRFTFPSSKRNVRPIDKLLSTKVERDIDLVTSARTDNFLTQEKQDNAIAINRNQLNGINNPSKLNENKELISKLLLVVDNDGQIIISDDADGENITLNDTNKFEAKSFTKSIETAKFVANVKLDNNSSKKEVVDNVIDSNQKTIEKVINLVAAEQAIQEKFGLNTIFVSDQSVTLASDQRFTDSLIKRLSSGGNNVSQSYYIDLPGYGNVEVKRAGTTLIVNQGGEDYIVRGVGNNAIKKVSSIKMPYNTWFTGGLEARDGGVYKGLMRETFKESAGTVYITKAEFDHAIKNNQFIYDQQTKTLAIIKSDNMIYDQQTKTLAIIKSDNIKKIDTNLPNTKLDQVMRLKY